jgi:Zn finger protein HypA/HybF involved in hydrogenase expression
MIQALCSDCGEQFIAPVILGITCCPKCGSERTHVAVPEAVREQE